MNNTEQIETYYVTDNDGILINKLYEGDKIVRKSQSEYKNKYILNFKKKESFVKVYKNPIKELWKELSIREYAVASALIPYISYKDGILRNEGISINLKDISILLDMDYDAIRKVIPVLEKKLILSKINRQSDKYADKKKNYYVVNPYLFLCGSDIEMEVADIFKESKWANISDKTREIKKD